jgi:hypothetical protein
MPMEAIAALNAVSKKARYLELGAGLPSKAAERFVHCRGRRELFGHVGIQKDHIRSLCIALRVLAAQPCR